MSELTLDVLDRDGALTEAVAELCGPTRAQFLRGAALGGAALLGALATPAPAAAELTDLQILRFGLRFEQLQATFYTQTEELGVIGKMRPDKQVWAKTLGAHERAHVKILKSVLGPKAEPAPAFDFGDANETDANFTKTAVAMEDLTVALLAGLTPVVHDRRLTAALFSLLTTEARHAAWARHIVRTTPAAKAFDKPRTLDDVRGTVRRTHFIAAEPRKRRRRHRPRFTG